MPYQNDVWCNSSSSTIEEKCLKLLLAYYTGSILSPNIVVYIRQWRKIVF